MKQQHTQSRVFLTVALLLLSAGWAANHFASMLGVLREQENLSGVLVNAAFGIYALGLLPSLLGGGALADRIGARKVVLTGGVIAALGNASLLLWHSGAELLLGRFIVGLGVGLAVSAGTAWAGKLRGASGVTLAGIFLTSGFASGPIASGLLAQFLPAAAALPLPFLVSTVFSLATVGLALVIGDAAPEQSPSRPGHSATPPPHQRPRRSVSRALAAALPVALWVFSCMTTAIVVLAERVAEQFSNGVLLPGAAAFLAFGTGLAAQMLSRRFNWGPGAGIIGAGLAAIGLALAGLGGAAPPLWLFIAGCLILGTAYGLCLQQGLLDIEHLAPRESHGAAIGIFYVFTYLGFGLPLLLEAVLPTLGATLPLLVLAGLACLSALVRALQLSRTDLLRRS